MAFLSTQPHLAQDPIGPALQQMQDNLTKLIWAIVIIAIIALIFMYLTGKA